MKKKQMLVISLIIIGSSLQADFLDNIVNKVTGKLEQKAEQVIEKQADAVLSDEPKTVESEAKLQDTTQASSKNDKVGQLKELIEMKKNGYITDSEFQKQKALILD